MNDARRKSEEIIGKLYYLSKHESILELIGKMPEYGLRIVNLHPPHVRPIFDGGSEIEWRDPLICKSKKSTPLKRLILKVIITEEFHTATATFHFLETSKTLPILTRSSIEFCR